jgi:hypothetical protein
MDLNRSNEFFSFVTSPKQVAQDNGVAVPDIPKPQFTVRDFFCRDLVGAHELSGGDYLRLLQIGKRDEALKHHRLLAAAPELRNKFPSTHSSNIASEPTIF